MAHMKSQEAGKYPVFSQKLMELNNKFSPALRKYNREQEDLVVRYASKDEGGRLIYSPVAHSKFPYQYTPENMMALGDALENHEEDTETVLVDIEIKDNDLVGKDKSSDIPHYFTKMHIDLLKCIIICNCIIDIDGTIDRSKE